MTTSVSNEEIEVISVASQEVTRARVDSAVYRIRHTLASRFLVLIICVAIVLSALAYGTVHYWSLSVFTLGAFTILCLWVVDAWSIGQIRISKNILGRME